MIITKNYFSIFLRLVLCCFVTILFMNLLSSSSYGYTYNNFVDFANQVVDDPVVNNNSPYYLQSRASLVSVFHDTIANILIQHNDSPNNYDAFVSLNDVDGYNSVIFLSNNNYEYELNTVVSGYNRNFFITGNMTIVCFKNNTWYYFTGSLSRYTNNGVVGLLTKDARINNQAMFNTQYNKKAFYLQNNYVTSVVAFEVAPLNETLQNGKEVVRLQYRQKDLYLGHFINLDGVDLLEYTLSFNNGTWSEHGYTELNNNNYNGNQNIYMSGDSVYVKSLLLNYYNTYEFNWGAWEGDSLLNQGTLYYYVLPINAVVSGGVIVSSGDADPYSTQDQTIDFLNDLNDYSTVGTDIDAFVSGDLAGTLGFHQYDSSGDIWRATIINFTDQVADALMYSGDPYYDISFHGQATTRIYASYFTTPETAWKQFVRLALIFGCLYAIYFQLFTIFNALTCGAPDEVIGNLSPDIYLYRM